MTCLSGCFKSRRVGPFDGCGEMCSQSSVRQDQNVQTSYLFNESPQTHCFLGFLTTGHTKTEKKKQGCCSDFVTSAGPGRAGLVGTAGRASDRQVRFPDAAVEFSPRVGFQCRLSNGVRTALVCNRMHEHQCAR